MLTHGPILRIVIRRIGHGNAPTSPGLARTRVGGREMAARGSRLSAEVDECLLTLARGAAPVQTVARVAPVMRRFSDFVNASWKLDRLADVTPEVAMLFIQSRLECGLQPSLPTQHERRATLRLLFRVARRSGMANGDP